MNATESRLRAMQEFLGRAGWSDASLSPLPGDASFRRYVRVQRRGESGMLMDAPPEHEDIRPYAHVANGLHAIGYGAPQVLASDEEQGFLLSEDLGDALFSRVLAAGQGDEAELYAAAVDLLAAWHGDARLHRSTGSMKLDDYDTETYMREVSLFCDWFLPAALGDAAASALREEYLDVWRGILAASPLEKNIFVHRDYHADNLLWMPDRAGIKRVGLLDFQDALWGHPAYDLVSLLEDARRDVPPALAEAMRSRYLAATGQHRESFEAACALLAAQRNSKIIGIFVRLSRRDGKHRYLSMLPRVWGHLLRDAAHPSLAGLREWLDRRVPESARAVHTPEAAHA